MSATYSPSVTCRNYPYNPVGGIVNKAAVAGMVGPLDAFGQKPKATFWLRCLTLGNGVLDTVPWIAVGSKTPTITRATAAMAKLMSGLWASVPAGTLRAGYLAATTAPGDYGGYSAEQAATQILTAPRDMTNAAWTKTNATATLTSVGIDGAANSATRLTATAIGGGATQIVVAAATSRTYSVWLRRVTGNGTVTIQQTGTTQEVSAQLNSVTYTRVQLNANLLNAALGIIFGTNGDAIDVDWNQFEAGAFATSPIPLAGVRNQDLFTYPSAGNVSTTAGTASAKFVVPSGTGPGRIAMDDAAASFMLETAVGTNVLINDGTASRQTASTGSVTAMNKAATRWSASSALMAAFIAGAGKVEGAFDGVLDTGANIGVGNASGSPAALNGMMSDLVIFSTAMTDAQIAAI